MKNKNINNSTKNNTNSSNSTKNNRNSKLDSINNNMKSTTPAKRSVSTTNVTRTNARVPSRTTPSRTASSVARTSPIVNSPISTDRNKTYIVLVWQSRSAGIIRRIMEVPGTHLTRTLDDIRMQKKAFSFYEKR